MGGPEKIIREEDAKASDEIRNYLTEELIPKSPS